MKLVDYSNEQKGQTGTVHGHREYTRLSLSIEIVNGTVFKTPVLLFSS